MTETEAEIPHETTSHALPLENGTNSKPASDGSLTNGEASHGESELTNGTSKYIKDTPISTIYESGTSTTNGGSTNGVPNLSVPEAIADGITSDHTSDGFTNISTPEPKTTPDETETTVDLDHENDAPSENADLKEKGDISFTSRQKPGPSSSLTAAEWDGGITKDDIIESFDDDVDDDEESEPVVAPSKLDKGKARAVAKSETTERTKKLRLIDLPLDVLKDVIKEVTNTTDLCSLSLTHKSLHALAIPHIYSRFDIVWPDQTFPSERTGVDALTYGLATLVSPKNFYARYIRKFSLGNGPKEWVNEYAIIKEGGKMLGTLVSLAIYKMETLETFSWDMPTGVLRDVWMALQGLENIKNIHVRWHDNTHTEVVGSQDPSRKIEQPTLSGFKNLKSLSVLDVDEITYLREMSVAIDKSFSTLKELRVGVALHAQSQRWVRDEESETTGTSDGVGEGGVIGLALSSICDFKRKPVPKPDVPTGTAPAPLSQTSTADSAAPAEAALTQEQLAHILQDKQQQEQQKEQTGDGEGASVDGGSSTTSAPSKSPKETKLLEEELPPAKQLKLETLDMERVPLSTRVLTKAFDFATITNLTLINCANHAKLFKILRRKYSPFPSPPPSKSKSGTGAKAPPQSPPQYKLHMKKIHTDTVSASLISFLTQTLAPNSLETLFLQETAGTDFDSPITISQITTAIRRHRLSLKRLLVDSCVEPPLDTNPPPPNSLHTSTAGRQKWKFTKDQILVITGKMPHLRELGFSVDYADWHFFLTRLPEMKNLKSLYIPHIIISDPREEVHKPDRQAEEMVNQIVDVVTLRPECAICYVGIVGKCYELLEGDDTGATTSTTDVASLNPSTSTTPAPPQPPGGMSDDEDEDEEADDDDDADEDSGDDEDAEDTGDETEEDGEADSDQENNGGLIKVEDEGKEEEQSRGRVRVRHREILFYDDKVAVFKARHARL